MTATKIQDIARRLSNQSWCRYWLNLNDSHDNVVMAIQCRDANGLPVPIHDINSAGETFTETFKHVYNVARTNDDGTPYVSALF